jgi:uncharacterized metal-binding protein/rhodanese-related sulfurtransferase
MDCTKCITKGCRIGEPCIDRKEGYLEQYFQKENQEIVRGASELVDGGRAGTLNRLEEIIEYARLRGYKKLGVAYCYGMEKEATLLQHTLAKAGFRLEMVSCTVDGATERDVSTDKEYKSVSCNPIGQAAALNKAGAEFTILMGLCLGHDVLIQKQLDMDFTTWVVKDRKTGNRPLEGLPGYRSSEDFFLMDMDNSFRLIGKDLVKEKLKKEDWSTVMTLLDLRGEEIHIQNGIPGSVQCLLKNLPDNFDSLLPDRSKEIVVYCNGGMQSLYAVMYLSLKGYKNVKSLSGGYGDGTWAK